MGLHLPHQPFHAESGDLRSATAQHFHGLFSKTIVKNPSSFNLAPHPLRKSSALSRLCQGEQEASFHRKNWDLAWQTTDWGEDRVALLLRHWE